MRPADSGRRRRRGRWLERARQAAERGPLGHRAHWTAPDHARPTGALAAERVLAEGRRLREIGLTPTLFCGGGWYTDTAVAEACAELGYVDCTPRASRPTYLGRNEAWASLAAPARIRLPSGRLLAAIPTTPSPRDLGGRFRVGEGSPRSSTSTSTTPISSIAADGRSRRRLAPPGPRRRAGGSRTLAAYAPRSRGTTSRGCKPPACPRPLRRPRPLVLPRLRRPQGATSAPPASTSSPAADPEPRPPALSMLALVVLDVAGLALGIYLALVVRELVRGRRRPVGAALARGPGGVAPSS